jgi:hypothetical protein
MAWASTPRHTDSGASQDTKVIVTSLAAAIGAGFGAIFATLYLAEVCRSWACQSNGLFWWPVVPMWATIAGVAAGHATWNWRLETRLVGALVLGWMAIHFVRPASAWTTYMIGLDAFLAVARVGFLFYWTLAAGLGVAVVWYAPRIIARWL